VCCDLSGILLNRFKGKIPRDLTRNFELVESDINGRNFSTKFDAIMANHSLHHMVNLEKIFSITYQNLSERGVFVTNDMIGRNGHMRWPETHLFIDFFWPFLAQHQRKNVLLERIEAKFMDHDCSTEGFEGIRSQDILQLILYQGFIPWKFFGTGGFIDVFVDRSFGHNFDVTNPDDLFLIKRMGLLNDILIDVGLIKPTVMFAYFVKYPVAEINYNNRSAFRSVRDAGNDPAWLTEAISEAARYQCSGDYMYRAPLMSAKNNG
jgi:SAM-dependent methyltransferase